MTPKTHTIVQWLTTAGVVVGLVAGYMDIRGHLNDQKSAQSALTQAQTEQAVQRQQRIDALNQRLDKMDQHLRFLDESLPERDKEIAQRVFASMVREQNTELEKLQTPVLAQHRMMQYDVPAVAADAPAAEKAKKPKMEDPQ